MYTAMKQLRIASIFLLSLTFMVHAQTKEQAEELFWDFEESRFNGDKRHVISKGEQLLPISDKLNPKWRTYFIYYLASAYENNSQMDKAVPLYLRAIEAEPNYYVPHRAMGFHYLAESSKITAKIEASTEAAEKQKLMSDYQSILMQALPYLEKSYACDSEDEQTLQTIHQVMTAIGPKAKPAAFKQRIAVLSKNCVTLLTLDE